MNVYGKRETDSQIYKTNGYHWGEGWWEGQGRNMGLRDTNYYV